MSVMRRPNSPLTITTASSPSSSRLTRHASIPALPVPDTANVSSFLVRKTARSMRLTSSISARKAGSRWPISGSESAASTRGCASLGPGPSSKRRGGVKRVSIGAPTTAPIMLGVGAMSMPAALFDDLAAIVGGGGLLRRDEELMVYECDGYTLERSRPEVVVLPRSTAEVSAIVRLCNRHGVRFVPRGAGTGLSGGCLPIGAPVMIGLSRMNRIVSVDLENCTARVEAGVVNREVTARVAPHGLYYAPDPSSQPACTVGGNVAENSGGPHTLKYGVTTNHVLSVELVRSDGEVVELGGVLDDGPGYDLRGVLIGAEGTFGLVTQATLRLLPLPEGYRTLLAVFDRVDDASAAVSGIIGRGIVPPALGRMDQLMVAAVEAAYHFGFPQDADAVLIIETDGLRAGLARQAQRIEAVCREHGAREVRI